MGADIYCAICAGPFTRLYFRSGNLPREKYTFGSLQIENQEGTSQQEDDKTANNAFGSEAGEKGEHGDSDSVFNDGNDGNDSKPDRADTDEACSDLDLEGCYDDDAISREESYWMKCTQVLGYNAYASRLQKSFLSGIGDGENIDFSRLEVPPGGDSSFPSHDIHDGTASLPLYTVYDEDEVPCIPFHPNCYALLRRAIWIQTGQETINQDALYNTLITLTKGEADQRLDINYGEPEPLGEQYWIIERGREVHLANPLKITRLDEKLKELPRSGTSLSNVREAPPWFWEVDSLPDDVNFSALSIALKTWASFDVMKTSLENISNGTLLGLANRRRIWGVAEYLAHEYATATFSSGVQHAPASETEVWIRAHAVNRQLPPTMLPNPLKEKDKRQESCFFVKSWHDTNAGASLELYWNLDGALVGIAKDSSLFGSSQPPGGRTDIITLPPGDWLQAMTLSFAGTVFNLRSCSEKEHTAWIAGVTIHTIGGVKQDSGSVSGPKRLLTVSPSNIFVGLSGQTMPNGISRLGLLECSREKSTLGSPVLEAEKLLWKYAVIPPNIRALPFETGYWKFLPLSFVQQEALILGTTHEELSRVRRLGVCVGASGDVLELGHQDQVRISYMPIGLTVEYEGQERRTIGWYDKVHMNWFDVDGAAGEKLTRLGIGINELPKRLEFVTSHGRHSQQFGDPQSNYIDWQQAEEGDSLVGIAASFGYPCGHNLSNCNLGTTSINALVMRLPPVN